MKWLSELYLRWNWFWYAYFKARADPRKAKELVLIDEGDYIHAKTYSLPTAIHGEKENDLNTLHPMPEFSFPKDRLDQHFVNEIKDFFK